MSLSIPSAVVDALAMLEYELKAPVAAAPAAAAAASFKKRPLEKDEAIINEEANKKLKSDEDAREPTLIDYNVHLALSTTETFLQVHGDRVAAARELTAENKMTGVERSAIIFAEKMYAHIKKEAQAWAEQQQL